MSLRSVAVALLVALVLLTSIGVAASHGDSEGGWRADDGGLYSRGDGKAGKGAGAKVDDESAGGYASSGGDGNYGVMSALGRGGGHGAGRHRGSRHAYGLRRAGGRGHKRARVVRRVGSGRSRGAVRRVSRGRRAAAGRRAPARRVSGRRVNRRLRGRGVRGNANGSQRRAARRTPVGAQDTSQPRPGTSTPDRPAGGSTSPPGGGSSDPGATPGGSRGGDPSPGAGPEGGAPGAGNPRTLTPLFAGIGLRPASQGGLIFTAPELRALPGGGAPDGGRAGDGSDGAGGSSDGDPGDSDGRGRDGGDDGAWDRLFGSVGEPLTSVADAVPGNLQWLITALAALATLALGTGVFVARRAGAAARRRRALLDDIGLLQAALLPPVPERVGGLRASVAYRPWEGPGAGGDFYDVFPLADGRAGVVLGDVAGHGREVIGRTSALRHTLRAYLDAGLEPRAALELAGRVLERDPGAPLATAVLGVHDPERGSLTWASAGHPLPILVGAESDPAPNGISAPPIGAGVPTGIRQTTVPFPAGTALCLFTDGLVDVRVGEGRLDRDRLAEIATELGPGLSAPAMLDRVSAEATEITDDMAVCVLRPAAGVPPVPSERQPGRVEELALPAVEVSTSTLQRFLWSSEVEADEALEAIGSARERIRSGADGVLVRVHLDRAEPVEIRSLERTALSPTA